MNRIRWNHLSQRMQNAIDVVLPLLVTTFLFLLLLPWTDFPVYDDVNIFHFGFRLLHGEIHLNVQWSPLLIYWAALINLILGRIPVVGFSLFHGGGLFVLTVGCVSFLRAVGFDKRSVIVVSCIWSFLYQTVMLCYPIPILHLYHFGIPALISAYYLRSKPISIYTSMALLFTAFLVRNESIIVLLPLMAAGIFRRKLAATPIWNTRFLPSLPFWALIIITSIFYILYPHLFQLGRMTQAFSLQFYDFALQTRLYPTTEAVRAYPEEYTLETVFGPNAGQQNLIALAIQNPRAIQRFLAHNILFFFRDSVIPGHAFISRILIFLAIASLAFLSAVFLRTRNGMIFCLILAVLIKIPIVLFVVPRFHYLADILFLALAIQWPLGCPRWGKKIALSLSAVVLILALYLLHSALFQDRAPLINRERVSFISQSRIQKNLSGALLAEYYAPFSYTLGSRTLKNSVPITGLSYADNRLSYSPTGETVDYVLIEKFQLIPLELAKWIVAKQPVYEKGSFYLYGSRMGSDTIFPESLHDPNPVIVAGSTVSFDDFSFRIFVSRTDKKAMVVRWDFDRMGIDPSTVDQVHLYIYEDCNSKLEFLGRQTNRATPYYVWHKNNPQVHPKFSNGPESGKFYQFAVFAIHKNTNRGPFKTAGPVWYIRK